MVLNTATDIRRVLHLDSSNEILTDTEIDNFLTESNTELFTEIKKASEIDLIDVINDINGNPKKNYYLTLTPILSFDKVLINNSVTDSSNYSIDTITGEIIFSSGVLTEGDKVTVFYQPKIYKYAELYLTAYNINVATQILNRGGDLSPVADNIEKKKNQFLNVINSRLIITSWH